MKKTFVLAALCAACLTFEPESIIAQNYTQTPVTVSKEKVRGTDGRLYYSHAVLERQTLFSIAKAYGVSVDDICNANPEQNLKTDGLKKDSIILIPVSAVTAAETPAAKEQEKPEVTAEEPAQQASHWKDASQKKGEDYFIHVAKWYEDLNDIAYKYSIPANVLMSYNGMSDYKTRNRQKIRIPTDYRNVRVNVPAQDILEPETVQKEESTAAQAGEEMKSDAESGKEEYFNVRYSNKVNAVLMLPFNASASPSSSSMDFYSGALLAVEKLKESGTDIDLSVYDVANGNLPITESRLRSSDLVIGPISGDQLEKVLEMAPENTAVVSPLDQKTASLAAGHCNMIQAPASQAAQYQDLLNWIKEEYQNGDKVLVISEKGPGSTSSTTLMNQLMGESGLAYSTYSYDILQGRSVSGALSEIMTKTGINRVVVNSEDEAFVNDVVRNLAMLVYRKMNVILYSPSKIRSFDTIDIENLHNLNTRISTSYYINYDSPEVTEFLLKYRALYNTEPTQFAFQGYDLTYFLLSSKVTFGRDWMTELTRMPISAMMQTDFKFRRINAGAAVGYYTPISDSGLVNEGVRRIVYGPDYKVRIVR